VTFRDILLAALEPMPGAIGAAFLDSEGESVDVASSRPFESGDHELRVIGAYAGIFLSQLRRIAEATEGGQVVRFKLDFVASRIFCCDLKDGYYLAFLAGESAVEALVWKGMQTCREALLAEM
jgi:hypothetical protein